MCFRCYVWYQFLNQGKDSVMFGTPGYQPQSFVESIVASRLGVNAVNPIEASVAESLQADSVTARTRVMENIKELEKNYSLSDAEKEWILNGNRRSTR